MNTFTDVLDIKEDVDKNDTHTYEVVKESLDITTPIDVPVDVQTVEIVENENGTWNYNVIGDFNSLILGETAIVKFQYVVIDNSGDVDTNTSEPQWISLTIEGTTDQEIVDLLNSTQSILDELVLSANRAEKDANIANSTNRSSSNSTSSY